ncbi:MAG: hypothetical protein OEW35_11125 [Gammaproteobacteria bacterium]|nr:hypothetical protein [Gammaproteobacteria bacterium]MDH4254331.1 hypothetical protein [Gammaproteobacteria bacterium]MDH5309617.1 hypothetical protein [Gammaproteobacteria bacterium]
MNLMRHGPGVLGALLLLVVPAGAAELVQEFSGTGTATTAEFEVEAPWILDWRVNSDYQNAMAIEISLLDGKTGFLVGRIVQTKRPGNGVRLFKEGGSYRVRVSATLARWTVKVEELTREELELYEPKKKGLL